MAFLFLSGEVDNVLVVKVYYRILNLAVRSGDEAKLIDSGIHTERRDKTDVRTLRALDRTQTTVVCIVNVSNLETCALTRKTARAKG